MLHPISTRSMRALIGALFSAATVLIACDNHSGVPGVADTTPGTPTPTTPAPAAGHDWPTFGFDVGRSSVSANPTGIDSAAAAALVRHQVTLDGTVDASAIYLHGVTVKGSAHDVAFVTTTYGKTIAIDARAGTVLWEFTPQSYAGVAGGAQITTSTPVADPSRDFIYAAASDGVVRKLSVADGSVVWSTAITALPSREKIASPLNLDRGHVIAVTGGYIGDAPPYQGHVSVLDAGTGALLHTWNSLCSDRAQVLVPSSCNESGSAIWGRAGAVVDSATGDIFVATGNGTWDGGTNWGDAVLQLDPNATQLLGNYTPANTAALNSADADVGSTSPVLLASGVVAQGGKDGHIRLLNWTALGGTTGHLGGETQSTSTPGGDRLFTAPAVWHASDGTWMFAASGSGTQAWKLSGSQLVSQWQNSNAGTSPIVADSLLYVYDPGGALRIYHARTGQLVARLSSGSGHWNSPIVVDGMVLLPEGNANGHQTSGVLDIWRAP